MAPVDDGERAHWAALARHRLGLRPTIRARRELAATLRAVADDLDRLADAEERQVARGNLDRPRGQGRAAGDFVRLGEETVEGHGGRSKSRLRLYVGRRLWYALGRPPRLDAQRVGDEVRLIAVRDGEAAALLGVKPGTLLSYVRRKKLRARKVNASTNLYRSDDVAALVANPPRPGRPRTKKEAP
jgi:hypothetical protein